MSTEAGRNYAQTAFVEIKPDGTMGELVVSPQSAASACVIKQAQGRVFPKPPSASPYAIKVTLKRDA